MFASMSPNLNPVICEFLDMELLTLYETGANRKHNITVSTAEKFLLRLTQLQASKDLNDLKSSRSIGLKKLRGGKNNYSINIDEAHILEFQVVNEGELSITPKILISNIITANE